MPQKSSSGPEIFLVAPNSNDISQVRNLAKNTKIAHYKCIIVDFRRRNFSSLFVKGHPKDERSSEC